MTVFYNLNFWTNIILLNSLIIRFSFYLKKPTSFKVSDTGKILVPYLLLLLIDQWMTLLQINSVSIYYITGSIIFIISFTKIIRYPALYFSIITVTTLFLYFTDSEIVIQFLYTVSIIVLLFKANRNLLKAYKLRYVGIVFIIIAMNLFSMVQEFTLQKIEGNWQSSQYLIYFAIGDYTVFTLMLLMIHAKFRRLFFT